MVVERKRLAKIVEEMAHEFVAEQALTEVNCDLLRSKLVATKSSEAFYSVSWRVQKVKLEGRSRVQT